MGWKSNIVKNLTSHILIGRKVGDILQILCGGLIT
jgi:hypothetical protein